VTPRLERRIQRDFGTSARPVIARLQSLELPLHRADDLAGLERIQAAVVLAAKGSWQTFEAQANLAEIDWRDVLVAADLADEDWPLRLDHELGPTE